MFPRDIDKSKYVPGCIKFLSDLCADAVWQHVYKKKVTSFSHPSSHLTCIFLVLILLLLVLLLSFLLVQVSPFPLLFHSPPRPSHLPPLVPINIILSPSSAHTCLTSPLFSSLLSFPVYHLPHLLTSLLLIPSSLPISCPVLYPAVDGHVFSFSCSSVSSYGTLQKCDRVTALLPPPPPPPVLFNPVKDIFFSVSPSCLFPPSICSSPPWHSAEVSPLCSSSCLHMVTLSPPLLLLFPSFSSASSDGARSNMTGCKNPPLSSFHPFSPPMESLPHSSIPLPSSPCLPVVFHHFRGPWDSKHDKVWKPACMLHTPPLVSTYGPVFHPDRFTDTERKLNISLKDYSQTMLWKWTASKKKSHRSCPDLPHFFQPFSGSLLKGVCRAVRTKRATNSRVMMEKRGFKEKIKHRLLSHLCTAWQSLREAGACWVVVESKRNSRWQLPDSNVRQVWRQEAFKAIQPSRTQFMGSRHLPVFAVDVCEHTVATNHWMSHHNIPRLP